MGEHNTDRPTTGHRQGGVGGQERVKEEEEII